MKKGAPLVAAVLAALLSTGCGAVFTSSGPGFYRIGSHTPRNERVAGNEQFEAITVSVSAGGGWQSGGVAPRVDGYGERVYRGRK